MCMMFIAMMAQQPTQTIKGRVIDMDSHISLPGVNVILLGTNPPLGTITDQDGYYALQNVPIGRCAVQYSFMGYESIVYNEVVVGSGKEVVLNVQLKESFQQLDEVVVKPGFRKDRAQNNMATLSARSFSVEEATRYAGGWNDPSRLAGSFAGVSMAEGVNDNAIVIRGNAPKGILWRLEGVEIPAPNHLNGVNNGGGIETIFSVNMLANSDFFTGAFPAEYGNAISGTFDMQFRNGNADKQETTLQLGSQGIDIGLEGPLSKNKKASFLINYRYSTMGLVGELVDGNFGMPIYQDLSFKFNLPTSNSGTFSFWGISGLSSVAFDPDEDEEQWTNTFDNNKYKTASDIAASGLTHHINVGKKTFVHSSVALTYDYFKMKSDQVQRNDELIPLANHKESNTRLVISSEVNHKVSNRLSSKSGLNMTAYHYKLNILGNEYPGISEQLTRIAKQSGSASLWRGFSEIKWRLSPVVDVNTGLSATYFDMNKEWMAEPRAGVSWRFLPKHALHMAYGKHSRLEPLRFYQALAEDGSLLNPDLKVSKAHHYVLAYDFRINEYMKLKIEPYYQELYDVPVVDGSPESLINYTWDMYFQEPLSNKGTGTNKGIDFTLERYMKDGYYYMCTATIFDSKYKGGDGVERNTSFNRGFVLNILGGKEWQVRQNNLLAINSKVAFMGGNRFTPANQEASKVNEIVVLDDSRAFDWQEKNKLFVDIAFNYTINKAKSAHTIAVQAKNALMQSEMFGWAYDFKKQKVVEHGITMVYPYVSYKVVF